MILHCSVSDIYNEFTFPREELTKTKTAHLSMMGDKNLEINKLKDEMDLKNKMGAHKKDEEQR